MSNTVKVGIFMTAALAVLAYLIFQIEDLRLFGPEGRRVEAVFDSVAGLDDKAAVRVAGVRVGRVDGIRLVDRQAVVGLLLETPVTLTEGATATISSLGLLGDKFIELRAGRPGGSPLPADAVLPGETPLGWDQAVAKFSDLGTALEESLTSLDPEATGRMIQDLLASLEATSGSVQELIEANRDAFGSSMANFDRFSGSLADELPRLTGQMERVLAQVESVMAENRGTLREGLDNVAEVAGAMRVSIDNLNQISGQVAAGEGSLGKLVASDEAHDQLTSTLEAMESGIDSLSETFGRVQSLGLDLAFDGYVLDELEDTASSFTITLDPSSSSRFYRLGVVDDPRGRLRVRTETETVTGPDGASGTTTTETRTIDDKFTLTAQFGFVSGARRLRAGIFESTAGAAVDYSLFEEKFRMSLEAFDFGREDDLDPRLRLTGTWKVHPNVYLLGGLDDFLVDDRETLFLGAGVRWSDDDLKYLLGSLPTGF
jgi:phospholipid/cholesterol/gamma-HCH transport system substrate-binding protein